MRRGIQINKPKQHRYYIESLFYLDNKLVAVKVYDKKHQKHFTFDQHQLIKDLPREFMKIEVYLICNWTKSEKG